MNNRIKGLFVNVVLVFLLVGCATIKLIEEKNVKWKSGKFSSELPTGWSKYSWPGNILSLTRDGSYLQYIFISKTKTNKELQKTKKKITEDLLLQELSEIIKDELSLSDGITNFEVISQKPANIDGIDAFRLEYIFKNSEMVDYHGVVYGFVFKKKYPNAKISASSGSDIQILMDFEDIKHDQIKEQK